MFKILRKNCCGLDVHKTWIFACIGITDPHGITHYKQARFSSFSKGLRELVDWLALYSCKEVCMESAGKYWIPVFNILEKSCLVTLAHPKYTKPQKGNKTDRKDARWICDLFMCDMIKPSFIPPPDIRHLRDLARYRVKLTNCLASEKNRAQNCLTVSNLKLDSVFSNVFCKSASAIISHMLEHPGEQFPVAPFVHPRCKSPIEDIQAAVDGAFSPWQAEKLMVIRTHMDDLASLKQSLEALIFKLAQPFTRQIELLLTVPGISEPMTAIRIIAEIGADMSQFESSKHLCSWAGLTPQNNESAGKKKTTRIGKAGQYIKPLLLQCAIAACNPRSKRYPQILAKYQQLYKRRGKKKARIAISRRLLTAIFHMLLNDEPYAPFEASARHTIPDSRVLTPDQALALLRANGYIIQEPPVVAPAGIASSG